MKKVYIPLNSQIPIHLQFPTSDRVMGSYEFVLGGTCKSADYVIVLDNIAEPITIECPPSNIFLFTGEPPTIKTYPDYYLKQFGKIFTCQKQLEGRGYNAVVTFPGLPWMLVYDFLNVKNEDLGHFNYFTHKPLDNDNRLDKVCLFTSNKKFCKGHCDRINFALRIQKELPDYIDIYGYGFNEVNNKIDVLSKYKYAIVIENTSYPNYWTEKLADTLLAYTVPFYYGDPNICDYFTREQVIGIDIFDIEKSKKIIQDIIRSNYYDKHSRTIEKARELVVNKYNMFERFVSYMDEFNNNISPSNVTLQPLCYGRSHELLTYLRKKFYQKLPYFITKNISL